MFRNKRCPTCTSSQIRRSQRRNIERALFFLLPILPHRCNECGRRFYILQFRSTQQRAIG